MLSQILLALWVRDLNLFSRHESFFFPGTQQQRTSLLVDLLSRVVLPAPGSGCFELQSNPLATYGKASLLSISSALREFFCAWEKFSVCHSLSFIIQSNIKIEFDFWVRWVNITTSAAQPTSVSAKNRCCYRYARRHYKYLIRPPNLQCLRLSEFATLSPSQSQNWRAENSLGLRWRCTEAVQFSEGWIKVGSQICGWIMTDRLRRTKRPMIWNSSAYTEGLFNDPTPLPK